MKSRSPLNFIRRLRIYQWVWGRSWRRAFSLREHFKVNEEAFHLGLAALVGIIAGVVNVGFLYGVEGVKILALRHPGDLVGIAELFHWWQRLIIPALGGLAAGLILHWGGRLVRPGSSGFMEAVVVGDGKLPFGAGFVRAVSSLVSVATGASVGREGAIAALSSTIASKLGQSAGWQPYRLRLMVGCGAAAGIAAAYNAPIAGAIFAAQIVLGNFSMQIFAPLVTASVVGTLMTRSFFGLRPWYQVPPYDFTHLSELYWFCFLGVIAGIVGAMFLRLLDGGKELFGRLKVPVYLRLMFGGLAVGAIAIGWPEVWGNGYSATNRLLTTPMLLHAVLGLLLAKAVATVYAVGSGTVGGVFTPTLFVGAAVGTAFGMALHGAGYATQLPTHIFALVGMGSVLAATVHSPLLAMIMIFEISLNYSMMPPLMLSCVLATLVARRMHEDSVYTSTLRDHDIDSLDDNTTLGVSQMHRIGDIMRAPVPPVRDDLLLPDVAAQFLKHAYNYLPVVNAKEHLVGLVALHDLKPHLHQAAELRCVIASDIMIPVDQVLTPNDLVLDALPKLLKGDQRNIPVVNDLRNRQLVGSVSRSEALALLSEAIAAHTRLRRD
jgi:CIC family chloride channel protein